MVRNTQDYHFFMSPLLICEEESLESVFHFKGASDILFVLKEYSLVISYAAIYKYSFIKRRLMDA